MLRQVVKHYLICLSAVLLLAPLLSYYAHAQVPAVSDRYVRLQNSASSATTTYTFGFGLPQPATIGSIVFEFCDESPLPNTPCTSPSGFSASSASLAQQSGESNFSLSGLSTVNKIIRAQYALVVGGSFGCALQTALFDSYPSEGTLIFVSAVLVFMILDFAQWHHLEKEHELKTSN